MTNILRTIFVFLILLIFNSCASRKTNTTKKLEKNSLEVIVENHQKAFLINDSYTVNSNISLTRDGKKNTAGTTFDFFTNEQIDLSISYFGFNIAKGSFNKNEFAFYEKVRKTYAKSDYSIWNKDLFNAKAIEKLLLGRFFIDLSTIVLVDYKQENNLYVFTFDFINPTSIKIKNQNNQEKIIKGGVAKFDSEYKTTEVDLISMQEENIVSFTYKDWQVQNGLIFPHTIQVKSQLDQSLIEIKHRSAIINNKKNEDFAIPSGYKEIDLKNLLNLN